MFYEEINAFNMLLELKVHTVGFGWIHLLFIRNLHRGASRSSSLKFYQMDSNIQVLVGVNIAFMIRTF